MISAPAGGHAEVVEQLAEILGSIARQAGMAPMLSIFNLGQADDYRVRDGGILRERDDRVYYPTAPLVPEVVSPGDETWNERTVIFLIVALWVR